MPLMFHRTTGLEVVVISNNVDDKASLLTIF